MIECKQVGGPAQRLGRLPGGGTGRGGEAVWRGSGAEPEAGMLVALDRMQADMRAGRSVQD